MNLPKLILASGSPRRAEILNAVGWEFEKIVPEVDESQLEDEIPEDYVIRVSKKKSDAVASHHPEKLILAADTVVVIENRILGKPIDRDDAKSMIAQLSGRSHEVLTGIALSQNGKTETAVQRTEVKFSSLSEAETAFLVENGSPLDKAGAYAVQAQAALFIEKIDGDYWNVVGLPINLVYRLAAEFG
ncbi:MAG: Maf family protein [Pyrinomonadaceae bacterium]